jgi:signal transduction histidine kinase
MVDGKQIGTLIIGTAFLDEQGKQLLDSLSSALLLTSLLTSVGAVGLALWLSGQLTAPVHDLLAGVKQLAGGHWSKPLAIRSQNEFADLTDAFNGMAEQLTQQQQQQRQMIADIAHDLRTPLSVIDLELEGIRSGLQTPEEATQSLQEEVNWLQHLIDDLHTLSLMDTGQFTLNLDDTALTPYLAALCEQWQAMAAKHEKTLRCDVPADLPVVAIDPFRLRQVLGNLLNNALQHTPAGTQVRLCAEAEADQVEISVTDNGPGIATDDLAHIFDRFYRADRARSRGAREYGSGLGLSIAQQLMHLHNGTLTVDSTLGKGTTFRVRLPVADSNLTPQPPLHFVERGNTFVT